MFELFRLKWGIVAPALLTLVLGACGEGSGDGEGMEEGRVGRQTQQSHGVCGNGSQSTYWVSGIYSTAMKSTSTHFCWLTKASGNFNGDHGPVAGLYVLPHADGTWRLTAESSESFGEATCSPLTCFSGDGVNDVVWVSGNFSAIANDVDPPYTCEVASNNAWWGDAATILQAWPGPGRTSGGGEFVQALLSGSASTPSIVRAQDCQATDNSRHIHAVTNSLFVGTPSGGKLARYTGVPFGLGGNTTLNLGVYTDVAMCFFTKITGKYRGGGELARLYKVYESSSGRYKWYAQTAQGGNGGNVAAEGRCFFYHQWDH